MSKTATTDYRPRFGNNGDSGIPSEEKIIRVMDKIKICDKCGFYYSISCNERCPACGCGKKGGK